MVLNKDDTLSYAKTSECSFVFSPIAVSRKVNMGITQNAQRIRRGKAAENSGV